MRKIVMPEAMSNTKIQKSACSRTHYFREHKVITRGEFHRRSGSNLQIGSASHGDIAFAPFHQSNMSTPFFAAQARKAQRLLRLRGHCVLPAYSTEPQGGSLRPIGAQ
jgi:hypothetical protein